jgi:transposase-like protein
MNPQEQLCPKCGASGKAGKIGIHSQKTQRYRCKSCHKTFSERSGRATFGLKKAETLFAIVITLLAYGCPTQAIVVAYQLDPRTVRGWLQRAGQHSQGVHEQTVGQRQWDLLHVQADEIKVRVQGGVMWVTLALMVSTRLWLGAVAAPLRSKAMIVSCLQQVARCALCRPLLLAVDGLNMYQTALKKAFRSQHPLGQNGRLKWVQWGNVILTQVVKARGNQRGNIEQVVTVGSADMAAALRQQSQGGEHINTAFIERFNATVRQRLACLHRRSRHALKRQGSLEASIALMGCVYNFCSDHDSLSVAFYSSPQRIRWVRRTPAMAAGLTDHRWTVDELLNFKLRRNTL